MKRIIIFTAVAVLFAYAGMRTGDVSAVNAGTELVVTGKSASQAETPDNGSPLVGKKETIDYALPYPGILIDHPLYFLKNIRDLIMERIITEPGKKVEFAILQSD